MHHCTGLRRLMNGSNHQEERDRRLLHLRPACLGKRFCAELVALAT
jgi:hypothetical protein